MASTEEQGPPHIPGYEYVRPLGSGGYSDVYLYEEQMPRRNIAVKVLKNIGLNDAMIRQFTAEANAMAKLADHPNIVSVIKADVTGDGRPYLVMTFYPKDNLGVRADRERFAVSQVLRIGIQIASAVETAHQAQILHRDIKPANILTNQYAVGLTDFGIASQATGAEDDDTGVSVPWSPPEVLYAKSPASVQSDIYSLAATLWHLLVGRSPFQVPGGDNDPLALMRRARDQPLSPTGRADVPTSLERLLAQAMSKKPDARPPSALDFALSLQAIEQGLRLPLTDIVVLHEDEPEPRMADQPMSQADHTNVRAPIRIDAQLPLIPSGRSETAPDIPISSDDAGPRGFKPTNGKASGAVHSPITKSSSDDIVSETMHRDGPKRFVKDSSETDSQDKTTAEVIETRRPRQIVVAVAVSVAVLVSVAVGIVVSSGQSTGTSASGNTTTTQPIIGVDMMPPPGTPSITGQRIDASTVEFTWTYSNSADTDSFLWQYQDETQNGTTDAPSLKVTSAEGQQVCLQVKVVRADGANAALTWSPPGCVS